MLANGTGIFLNLAQRRTRNRIAERIIQEPSPNRFSIQLGDQCEQNLDAKSGRLYVARSKEHSMADPTKAIFLREFHYTSRRRNAGWSAYPCEEPQSFPREFNAAAITAGCAEPVEPTKAKPTSKDRA
jgi:hypothetical protein